MNIIQIYKKFPTKADCIKHLEEVRWKSKATCPYCQSQKATPIKKTTRYHCNSCNTSFSVTVGTIFHNTKLDMQKWFLATSLVLNAKKGISARQLARDIEVTKDTAWFLLMRLRKAMTEHSDLLEGIVEADETYVGGKNKNKHKHKRQKGTQGRSTKDKEAVFGVLERGGKIKAKKVKDVKGGTLKRVINDLVRKGSTMVTDEWGAYNGLNKNYNHLRVDHGKEQYVVGEAHTNTIEGFWSLLKRGIVGQYHKVSAKYLNLYIQEFCYRYNNRENDTVFSLTISKAVGHHVK